MAKEMVNQTMNVDYFSDLHYAALCPETWSVNQNKQCLEHDICHLFPLLHYNQVQVGTL